MNRWFQFLALAAFVALWVTCASGQDLAALNGRVTDPKGLPVPGVNVQAVNVNTNISYPARTNDVGLYSISTLPPGIYRIIVEKDGFLQIVKPGVELHVSDIVALNFALEIGSVSESVTVEAGAPIVNTESAAVSTVIDRNLVENLPLNGRSFNTLLQLTPGVVLAQGSSYANNQGQFSIAGQRSSANNFLIDGVSANFGVSPSFGLGSSGTGAAQAFSALGGTSSLVSVEALQEFRIETSSFAPEFGRSPGGQVILTTRSGTNEFHGGIYEYFRNTVMDANDWFAKQAGEPRAPENHNDFGGFLGGAIRKGKLFFFLSYEQAQLREPNSNIVEVPSEYARTTVPAALAPFLLAYPQPNDKTVTPGVYTGEFTGNYSNPSTLHAGSIRIDQNINSRFSIFGRYNQAPSDSASRNNNLAEVDTTTVNSRTVTIGVTMALSPTLANSLRANYSAQDSSLIQALDNFGGAVPPPLDLLGPNLPSPSHSNLDFYTYDTSYYATGPDTSNGTKQINLADDLSIARGAHQFKFGADYRDLYLDVRPYQNVMEYLVSSVPDFITNGQALIYSETTHESKFRSQAASIYAQDTWKATPRFTLTYGVRWELSPAPTGRGNTIVTAWKNVNNPSEISLAPSGSPIWGTTYTNFAPRVGAAYSLTPRGDFVLRAGFGVFYDLGSDAVGSLASSFPNDASQCCLSGTLPLSDSTPFLPVISLDPPYNYARGFAPNLSLPRSYQWNVALEKSFAGKQALSVTYVGQAGRDLLRQESLPTPNSNFANPFTLTTNTARSNYNALQVQFRRPVTTGLQALLGYTWSHSLDNVSNDILAAISNTVISAANDYASSDYDVRQSFSGALSYAIPSTGRTEALKQLTEGWTIEAVAVARTGFPFNGTVLTAVIGSAYPRPDLVEGQPLWIANPQAGGGKSLNPAAFTVPPAGEQGSEGRNDIPGFGLTQFDLSFGRVFRLGERLNLQFRTDAFNIFNHPNFTNPYAYIGVGPTYLSSTSMLNHGLGGLSPIFQEGGPRSLQLSLKLTF